MTTTLDIVDFHTHLWPPEWGPGGAKSKPSSAISPDIHRRIADPQALLDEFAAAGVNLSVVSTTIESLFGVSGETDGKVIAGVNDWLAGARCRPSRQARGCGDHRRVFRRCRSQGGRARAD